MAANDGDSNQKTAFDARIIGAAASKRLSQTSLIYMPSVPRDLQLMHFDQKGFALSAGSACFAGSSHISPLFQTMGLQETIAEQTIRLSMGWQTTKEEIQLYTKLV